MSDRSVEAAPAKVNLALHVLDRRQDGYHELESLVVFADVADKLEAVPAQADRLTISGPFAGAIANAGDNLVMRAVAAFRQRWPDHLATGLDLTLQKNLPVAAGLGGGSADAAAALRLMVSRASLPIEAKDLLAVALSIGADVPACLLSRPCIIRGIGERVSPLRGLPELHMVLVNPLLPVATADVFRHLQRRQNAPLPAMPESFGGAADLAAWLDSTRNDLQTPAIMMVAEIGDLIMRLRRLPGCLLARMSGSGATVFGLFGSQAEAEAAAADLRKTWPGYWAIAARVIQPAAPAAQ